MRQALAAELRRAGQGGPAAFGELLIGSAETVRGLYRLALRVVAAALLVAGTIERSQDVFRQFVGFLQNGATEVVSELALTRQRLQGGISVEHLVKNETHITKGCAVLGHVTESLSCTRGCKLYKNK